MYYELVGILTDLAEEGMQVSCLDIVTGGHMEKECISGWRGVVYRWNGCCIEGHLRLC